MGNLSSSEVALFRTRIAAKKAPFAHRFDPPLHRPIFPPSIWTILSREYVTKMGPFRRHMDPPLISMGFRENRGKSRRQGPIPTEGNIFGECAKWLPCSGIYAHSHFLYLGTRLGNRNAPYALFSWWVGLWWMLLGGWGVGCFYRMGT